MLKTLIVLSSLGVLLCGCPARQTKCVAAKPAGGDIKATVPVAPAAQESLLAFVPQATAGVMLVRHDGFKLVRNLWANNPVLKAELGTFLRNTLGVDLTEMKGLVFYVSNWTKPAATIFLRMDGPPPLKGPAAGEHRGIKKVRIADKWLAASLPRGIVLGNQAGVEQAIDLSKGQGKPLAKVSSLSRMMEDDYQGTQIIIGADLSNLPDAEAQVREMVNKFGVRTLFWSWDQEQRLNLEVRGDPAKLPALKALLMTLARVQLERLRATKDQIVLQGELMPGVSSMVGYHLALKALDEVEPQVKGGAMTVSYKMPALESPYYLTAVAGILAAVAIPAFVKYVRKAKTVEATEGLDKIRIGARAFFQADLYSKRGKLLPRAFPPSSKGWTPAQGCCGQNKQKCEPAPGIWDGVPWRALQFSMAESHYYQYRFTSAGKGKDATFTAEARGDLDCDGEFSSYKIMGGVVDGEVRFRGPLIQNEIE